LKNNELEFLANSCAAVQIQVGSSDTMKTVIESKLEVETII